jgi:hypothetical protein
VRDVLQSYYYWYSELPSPDVASFASPEAYLDAVRYRTLDSTYSYINSKAASDAFFSDEPVHRLRPRLQADGDLELRLTQTFPGSPAAEAGMDPRPVPGVDRRQACRRPHPQRRDRHDLRPRAGRLLDVRSRGARRAVPSGARRSPSGW